MERIIIAEFDVPNLIVGRTVEEMLQNAVAFARDAAFLATASDVEQVAYAAGWTGAINAWTKPITLEGLDPWLTLIHDQAATAQVSTTGPGVMTATEYLQAASDIPRPLTAHSLDEWKGDPVGDYRLAACCNYLWINVYADTIIRRLQKPLDLTDALTASAQRVLCVEAMGLSRPAALAGAAVLYAAARVTTRIRLVDVVNALDHLHVAVEDEAEEDLYSTSRQAIQDRLKIWNLNCGLTDEPTGYQILTADQREED